MKPEDKAKPVKVTVTWHPNTLRLARALGEFYGNSSVDHISQEAILDAAKASKFAEWLENHPMSGAVKEPPKPNTPKGPRKAEEAA